jgi:centromere protein I
VEDFVRHLERIELPNQLVAVIGDPLLQKFLQLKHSEATSQRIDNWLLAFFEDELQSSHSSASNILNMLHAIQDYTCYTKVCFSVKPMIDADDYLAAARSLFDVY